MFTHKIILPLSGYACLLASAAVAQTTAPPVTPPVTITRSYVFLPVGLAPTETAQINVVNTAALTPTGVSSTSAPIAPPACTGTISFLSSTGAVIGKPSPFTAAPGQIVSASLPYGSAGVTGGARTEIRGEIQITSTPGATPNYIAFGLCSLSYSLETYDTATGVTHTFTGTTAASPQVVPLQGLGR